MFGVWISKSNVNSKYTNVNTIDSDPLTPGEKYARHVASILESFMQIQVILDEIRHIKDSIIIRAVTISEHIKSYVRSCVPDCPCVWLGGWEDGGRGMERGVWGGGKGGRKY